MEKSYIKKHKLAFLKCLAFSTCVFASSSQMFAQETATESSAQETVDDEIFNMSLEAIMNMEITVASKKSEKLSDAPGMITSYSKDDIQRYGYYTLKDLANITSGYSTFSAFGETNLETRGQKAGSWNTSKHLLLIDGIPVNHARANSAPLEYQIPLFFAERVEFLKGPGSALYGTSAFYGVMSVTSKDLKKTGAMAESRLSYGDLGNSVRIMGNAIVKTDIGQTKVSFSHFKKGFSGDSLGFISKNSPSYTAKNFDNDNSTFLNTSFKFTETKLKGLSAGMIYMKRNSHAGEFWGATPSPNNEVTWEEVIPYLRYQRELSEKLSLNSYVKYNASTEKSTFVASWNTYGLNSTAFEGYSYTTKDVEGLAELSYNINESSSLIGGVNFYTRQEVGDPSSFNWFINTPTDTSVTKNYSFLYTNQPTGTRVSVASAYLQYQKTFNVMKGLILTAGSRFDQGFTEIKPFNQFSPRVGLVLKATDKLNFKVLYGKALRVPGIKEIGLNAETIADIKANGGTGKTGDIPSVGPENIQSIEAGINYNTALNGDKSNLSFGLAVFHNITKDALDGTQYSYVDKNGNAQNPNYFQNTKGNITANGLELDVQYAVNKDLRFMVNHAIAKAVINDTIDFTDVPTQKTNFSATYVLPGSFRLASTLVARHVWGYTIADKSYTDAQGNNLGTSLGGYTLLDVNFQAPINDNMGVELQVRNILNTDWRQPSLMGQSSMIPLQGRNFMLTLYTKF